MIEEKNETGPDEQPRTVSPEDWDIAVMHGQYSQGDDREDLVTFRRIDLAAYLAQMRHAASQTLRCMHQDHNDYRHNATQKIKVLVSLLKEADDVLSTITDDEGLSQDNLATLRHMIGTATAWEE